MGHGAAPHASCDSRADGAVAARRRRGHRVAFWAAAERGIVLHVVCAGCCGVGGRRSAAGGALSVVCAVATPTTRHCTACVAGPGVCRHLVAVVSRSTVGGQRVPHNGPLSPRYTFTFSQSVSQLFHIPPEYSLPGATQISIVASEIHMEIHVHVYLLSRSVQLSVRETCACRSGHRGRAASCDAAYTRTPLSMHHGMHPPPVPDQRRHTHARTRHTLEFNTTGSRRHLHIRCTSDYTTSPCRSHWLSYPRRRCSPAQLAGHPRLTSSWP